MTVVHPWNEDRAHGSPCNCGDGRVVHLPPPFAQCCTCSLARYAAVYGPLPAGWSAALKSLPKEPA